jgi:uncharacterized protein
MINKLAHSGLLDRDLRLIREAANTLPEIRQIILFGSRAKGTQKTGSDVDLAIKGEAVSYATALRLADLLNEEQPLPYFFDVLNYHSISEPELKDHIDRVGVILFEKSAPGPDRSTESGN